MPGMTMRAEHTLRSISANQTDLSLKFSFQGVLGEIVGRLYRKIIEAYLETEAKSLQKRVEKP